MAAHPRSDDRHLPDPLVRQDALAEDEAAEDLGGRREVLAPHGEREIRLVIRGDRLVLDDHVDVHLGLGERAEDAPGDPGLVANAGKRDAGLLLGVGHGGYEGALHGLGLSEDDCTGAILERAPAMDAYPVVAGVLHRAQL